MAAAPRGHAPPNTPRRAVLQRTRRTAAARTAPIRGLSPQSGPDVDDDGSVSCSKPAPAPEPREPLTGARRAWSSAETVATFLTIAPPPLAFQWIALPARSMSRQARPCHGPCGYGPGLQQVHRAAFPSKRTVLGQLLVSSRSAPALRRSGRCAGPMKALAYWRRCAFRFYHCRPAKSRLTG